MKKSTLITTIAMIVVVVVALSTATYAWFSASTSATITTTITTGASSDWALVVGSYSRVDDQTDYAPTFTSQAVTTATLGSNMVAGPFSPTGDIASEVGENGALTGLQSFYTAKAEAGATTATEASFIGTVGNNQFNLTPAYMDVLRVKCVAATTPDLMLGITINVHTSNTTNNIYAGQAIRYYVSCYDGTATTNYSNSYNAGSVPNASTVATKISVAHTDETTAAALAYDGDGDFAVSQANENLGIAEGDYVYTYTIKLADAVEQNGFIYVAMYTWLDGWTIDANGSNAELSVTYGFYSQAHQSQEEPSQP